MVLTEAISHPIGVGGIGAHPHYLLGGTLPIWGPCWICSCKLSVSRHIPCGELHHSVVSPKASAGAFSGCIHSVLLQNFRHHCCYYYRSLQSLLPSCSHCCLHAIMVAFIALLPSCSHGCLHAVIVVFIAVIDSDSDSFFGLILQVSTMIPKSSLSIVCKGNEEMRAR